MVWEAAGRADVILHAGDVLTGDLLDDLERHAPVHAVLGNNDHGLGQRLPVTLELELDGVVVAMIHDSGPADGRLARMRRTFPDAQAVVFGHSHIPLHEEADGFAIFNPGSPTERRRAPRHTMGMATVRDGAVAFELIALD